MNQRELNEAEWADPANWRRGIYRSARDTRVFVPKRPRWAGWTLNFAHNASVWWLMALLTAPLAVVTATLLVISGR